MKLEDFRPLEDYEVALVLDNGKEHVAVARHNQTGGTCDCCKNWSVEKAEVVFVRNAVTGEKVWPEGERDGD